MPRPPSGVDRKERKALITYVMPQVARALKLAAVDRETTVQAIVEEAIQDWLTKDKVAPQPAVQPPKFVPRAEANPYPMPTVSASPFFESQHPNAFRIDGAANHIPKPVEVDKPTPAPPRLKKDREARPQG